MSLGMVGRPEWNLSFCLLCLVSWSNSMERWLQAGATEPLLAKDICETWGFKLCFNPDGQDGCLALENLLNTSVNTLRTLFSGGEDTTAVRICFIITDILSSRGRQVDRN